MKTFDMIEKLANTRNLSDNELTALLQSDNYDNELFSAADKKRREIYGDEVYIRGLIEFTNYCKNNCYYCGIRRDNKNAVRYYDKNGMEYDHTQFPDCESCGHCCEV